MRCQYCSYELGRVRRQVCPECGRWLLTPPTSTNRPVEKPVHSGSLQWITSLLIMCIVSSGMSTAGAIMWLGTHRLIWPAGRLGLSLALFALWVHYDNKGRPVPGLFVGACMFWAATDLAFELSFLSAFR